MQIAHLKISNILGLEHFELTPAGVNVISGPNGKGKTSVLEAIKAATGTGHDATLLRKGAERGEAVLVLDDGTEIQLRTNASRTTRDVVQGGKKSTRPSDVLKQLTDTLSVNPVEFLAAPKKDRVKVLLQAMPLTVDFKRLSDISGIPVAPSDEHALSLIDEVRRTVFEDRTGTNRAVKEKEATINQLETAMPAAPGGIEGDEDELRAQLESAKAARDAEAQRIDTKLAGLRAANETTISELKAAAQAKIDAIKETLAADIEFRRGALIETETKAARFRQKTIDACAAATQPLEIAIAAIVANRDAAAKRKATLETIETMRSDLADLEADAAAQTKAIDAIDAYKLELLSSLPIPDVEVRDGEIFRAGVPFDRLNTAQRVGIAFEIAKLRAGQLRVVCLDGMELLDSEHLEELERQASESGMQVFVTRVTDKDFAVETK